MPRAPLPDPTWTEAATVCVGCGYALTGLPVPGRCPECGAHYEARQLILSGVARTPASTPRRLAWVAIGIVTVVLSQVWPLFLFHGWWMVPAALLVLVLGWGALLIVFHPRERRGTERFCVTPSGFARVPPTYDPGAQRLDSAFIPWSGLDAFDLKRISPVWRRLRIGRKGPRGHLTSIVFEAGIRCPDASADIVRHTLIQHLAPPNAPAHPPTSPPPLTGRG